MINYQALSEIWEIYTDSLEEALVQGYIDDDALAPDYIWPIDLGIGNEEREDVKRYVHERLTEIVGRIKTDNGLDPNLLASYLFRSIVVGMLWQVERDG